MATTLSERSIIVIFVLDSNITGFMAYWREHFSTETTPPKMHILEEHVLPFVKEFHAGLGFYGEQGGESIHNEFNTIRGTCSHIFPATNQLKSILKKHYLKAYPEVRNLKPERNTRGSYNKQSQK